MMQCLLDRIIKLRTETENWEGLNDIASQLRGRDGMEQAVLLIEGRVLQGKNEHKAAIEKYKSVLVSDLNSQEALRGIAVSHLALEDRSGLVTYLTGLIDNNPTVMPLRSLLAEVYISEQAWPQVANAAQEGLAANQEWQGGYLILAEAQSNQGDDKASIATYERGHATLPNDAVIALRLASSYERQQDYVKAKAVYESILEQDPNMNVAVNNLASLLTDHFRTEENLQKALQISEVFSTSTEPYFMDTYAWVNVHLGHLQKAQSILEKVVEQSPDVAVFNYHLGVAYFKNADSLNAEKYLNQAQVLAEKQGDSALLEQIAGMLSEL